MSMEQKYKFTWNLQFLVTNRILAETKLLSRTSRNPFQTRSSCHSSTIRRLHNMEHVSELQHHSTGETESATNKGYILLFSIFFLILALLQCFRTDNQAYVI